MCQAIVGDEAQSQQSRGEHREGLLVGLSISCLDAQS